MEPDKTNKTVKYDTIIRKHVDKPAVKTVVKPPAKTRDHYTNTGIYQPALLL